MIRFDSVTVSISATLCAVRSQAFGLSAATALNPAQISAMW